MADSEPVRLTPIEQATLNGLAVARLAVSNEIDAYAAKVVAARLGVHPNRIKAFDVVSGVVTLASDAPKPEEAKKE